LAIARCGEHIDEGRRSALILLRRRPVLCLKNETGWSGTVPALALATASVGRRQNAAEPRVKPRSGLREFFLADPKLRGGGPILETGANTMACFG